uniref:tRNA-splicing endonuclease subunit Sen15 domain-containing protein n=1 Tax=Naja naja TaxID=35670 RepID=A0A8C7E445_NAJNA
MLRVFWAGGGAPKSGKWALREDWLTTHPTFTKMMSLEAADSRGVYAAFLVYLDLLEVRNWHEVSFTGLAEFQLVCLHGREKETEPLQIVVPTPAQVSFSHERQDIMHIILVFSFSLSMKKVGVTGS